MESYNMRGRGIATNVPEQELIEQVKKKALLYDKNVKEYRKPGVTEAAWKEVAAALNTTVTNCKKRWKSLRDTFIKYYRLDMHQNKNKEQTRRKFKSWIFYKDLMFLQPHVELFRLDDTSKSDENTIPVYLKDDFTETESHHFYFTEEEEVEEVRYQIKITNDEFEDTHNKDEEQFIEERLEDPGSMVSIEEEDQPVTGSKSDDPDNFVAVNTGEEPPQLTCDVSDPDERYLLSCLPAFKRFTPQQKAYVRMGIERLFYEVEFENADDPKNKRQKYC